MPSNADLKLSVVAREYLLHHDELEAARERFRDERAKILDSLALKVTDGSSAKAKRDDGAGSLDVYVNGQYVALRAKSGDKRSSGYTIAIGSYLGHVGAQVLLWFQLRLNPSRRTALAVDALAKEIDAQVVTEGSWLYFRTLAQPAADLDLAAVDASLDALSDRFAFSDRWLTERYPAKNAKE